MFAFYRSVQQKSATMAKQHQLWKNAVTVMLLKKCDLPAFNSTKDKFNYKILMLERSGNSKFMPSAYVFPGGYISNFDYNLKWRDILLQNANKNKLENYGLTIPTSHKNRSPILCQESENTIANNAALRICGIRETFEETGIILSCCDNTKAKFDIGSKEIQNWRETVCRDDSMFLPFCKELHIIPDIWSMFEWSNWLTPTHMTSLNTNRRYDTMFYISFVDESVEGIQDDKEIVYTKVKLIFL